jgi:hypothetical protein
MLVPGNEFGDSSNKCYFPIFMTERGTSDDDRNDHWYIGNLVMRKYYVAFDMSTLD